MGVQVTGSQWATHHYHTQPGKEKDFASRNSTTKSNTGREYNLVKRRKKKSNYEMR